MEVVGLNLQSLIDSVNRIKEEILNLQDSIKEIKNEIQLNRVEIHHIESMIQERDKKSKAEKLKEIEKEIRAPIKIINLDNTKRYEKGSFDDYMLNTIVPKMLKEQEESSKRTLEKLKAKGIIIEESNKEKIQDKTE